MNIQNFPPQPQQHCDAVNYHYANGFQCVDNPYAYSDFAGITTFAHSNQNQCKINAPPVGFITIVNGACYNKAIKICDNTAKTVSTQLYTDSSCTEPNGTPTIQSFSDYGMGTCDSNGFKMVCSERATNKYVVGARKLLALAASVLSLSHWL
eukprot:CAMPEP_0170082622 /NCGR_PEP_ID=MMETSP0019_2-20121128/18151_1 /TAXON_ID=98059 /ORGANISM="Dinobryon sp., Strain UTEXLB2267" /LENGTH=151 /DNA_ID=CAMNT_0010297559 /DNA_START=391 /DNA_END=846 /DNA_ORIENTATION=+